MLPVHVFGLRDHVLTREFEGFDLGLVVRDARVDAVDRFVKTRFAFRHMSASSACNVVK